MDTRTLSKGHPRNTRRRSCISACTRAALRPGLQVACPNQGGGGDARSSSWRSDTGSHQVSPSQPVAKAVYQEHGNHVQSQAKLGGNMASLARRNGDGDLNSSPCIAQAPSCCLHHLGRQVGRARSLQPYSYEQHQRQLPTSPDRATSTSCN